MAGFGGTIKLQGESEYKKALREITSNLKLVGSELKLTNAQFTSGDKNLRQTKNSYDNANKSIQDQKEKISVLKDTLSKMESQYGSNNEKVKNFKTQLNKAEVELKNMETQTDKSSKEIKNMAKSEDEAGNSAIKMGDLIKANILSEAIIGGIKTLGSVMKQVGGALVSVGKQAVQSYADFEQLEGGVKTLFGTEYGSVEEYASSVGKSVDSVKDKYDSLLKAQNIVFKDANDAYKDAGVSANEYMEMATSFSASLVSSLKGDTVKAAETTKMAIVDMSDNANKMGTDMSMIQSAYQGFAKQNYTMLDNLKLGYGGTKTEMQRLLKDAQKLTGVKYDINNLNDVYSAIHAIQENLGITGTTQAEAAKTISGSINSLKAAWSNLLTGVADDNADFNQLVNNFVDGLITAADNLLPRIGVALEGVGLLITDLLGPMLGKVLPILSEFLKNVILQISDSFPDILSSIGNGISLVMKTLIDLLPNLLEMGKFLLQSLLNGIQKNLPSIVNTVLSIITTLINDIIQMLPQILKTGITMLVELAKGIAQALPDLIPVAINAILTIVDTLLDNIDQVIDAGIELLIALTEGIMNALPDLVSRLPEIIIKITMKLIELAPKLLEASLKIIKTLGEGLIHYVPEMIRRIPSIINSMVNEFKKGLGNFNEIGSNLLKGIWNGISNATNWLISKIKGLGRTITNAVKSVFGIHSPSKVFQDEVGKNLALGLGEGFEDTMVGVTKDMTKAIPTSFDMGINFNTESALNTISSSNKSNTFNIDYSRLASELQDALKGMAFKVDNEKFGELVIDKVEKVVYA